jgi:hypothetical protein
MFIKSHAHRRTGPSVQRLRTMHQRTAFRVESYLRTNDVTSHPLHNTLSTNCRVDDSYNVR